jgi:hypothetical protein
MGSKKEHLTAMYTAEAGSICVDNPSSSVKVVCITGSSFL